MTVLHTVIIPAPCKGGEQLNSMPLGRGEGGPGHKKGEKRSDHTEFLNDPLLVRG